MLVMLLALAFVVALDRATKAAVVARLPEGGVTRDGICGVRLRHVANRRHPWGSHSAVRALTIAWTVIMAIGCAIASAIDMPALDIALGSILGGATGNLIDGVGRRAVIDFIDLRVWPVFNVADLAIVVGATALAWGALRVP